MDDEWFYATYTVLPPTLHRDKYLFCHLTPSEEVTHEFYRQLYPNTIRDIDVSS